ncbi:Piso0_004314 [Millerozyma farinosa CBS 7064]|uniref:Piso0_004314 protein n=1 Tax=Pichia sorbitophila (strain ATCC MYA-4447 / BCRC 22081 / CBS 7064 / NBRC 10061 / NRRL Y-12695) TaxID=559304 RepID=G8Y8G4_PICSO|nr:Piso0_004314 [Millerozyma farinosa CBS 7064]CCE84759.1 Piso0_004314 [Millerozyma farinosa CBS 7064]
MSDEKGEPSKGRESHFDETIEEGVRFKSPGKQLKNLFKTRSSASSSLESISKQLEHETKLSPTEQTISSYSLHSQAQASSKTSQGSGLNTLLRPKFIKFKHANSPPRKTEDIIPLPATSSNSKTKPTKIEDFADTSSSSGSGALDSSAETQEYDFESINSILQDYEPRITSQTGSGERRKTTNVHPGGREERRERPKTNHSDKHFVFVETLDDSGPSDESAENRNKEQEMYTAPIEQKSSIREADSSSDNNRLRQTPSRSDSNVSSKKTVPSSKSKIDRRKIISTSSNIDVYNITSMSNMTTFVDAEGSQKDSSQQEEDNDTDPRYPDPTISSTTSPVRDSPGTHHDSIDAQDIGSRISLKLASDHDSQSRPISGSIISTLSRGPNKERESKSFTEANFGFMNRNSNYVQSGTSSKPVTGSSDNTIPTDQKQQQRKNSRYFDEAVKTSPNRTSLSSGELLSKLETFLEDSRSDSEKNTRDEDKEEDRDLQYKRLSTNLVAGLDSRTDLPIVVYKVETTPKSNEPDSARNEKPINSRLQSIMDLHNSSSESEKSLSRAQSRIRGTISHESFGNYYNGSSDDFDAQTAPSMSHYGSIQNKDPKVNFSSKIQRPPSIHSSQDSLSRQSSHRNMFNEPSHDHFSSNAYDLEKTPFDTSYGTNQKQYDKYDFNYGTFTFPNQIGKKSYYSFTLFMFMMLMGLIVPPIYALVTFGFFDNYRYDYRTPEHLLVNRVNNYKSFSTTQKMISFGVGLSWLCIAIAMLVVGITIGIKNE